MDFVMTTVTCVSCLFGPKWLPERLIEQCNYLKKPKKAIEELRNEIQNLSARVDTIRRELHLAKLQEGKEPKKEVEVWLENVQKIINEVQNVEEEFKVEKRCSNLLFINYCSRFKTGKHIRKKIEEVIKLLKEGQFLDGSLAGLLAENGMTVPTTTLAGKNTTEKMKMILKWLMDDEIQRIGVYGMGGVGKTTIMSHINNQLLKDNKRFDTVIWVTVSQSLKVEKLQDDIAKAVNLDLSNDEDEMRRPAKLLKKLTQMKRFLLILDDMWEAFPLEKIGVPEPTKENECKLLITTRSLIVCRMMECQRNVLVELLSEEEAWDLFMDKVGPQTMLTSDTKAIAKSVAKECACLPLAIITIGRCMSGVEDIREWRNALNELQISTNGIKNKDRKEHKVIERLKFSYNRLKDETLQNCFLFCALYPEDYAIPTVKLIEYWTSEELIDRQENRQADFDQGQTILNKLINSCLLESVKDFGDDERVKMHDLVRDMALAITRERPLFMVKASVRLKELPNEEEWTEGLHRVSLMRNNIVHMLSHRSPPRCPGLSTLLLQWNRSLNNISQSFFVHLHGLKVLDLSFTNIQSLPNSISDLENLRALHLRGCDKLTEVPSLAKLNALRVLDLAVTGIKEVPQGMERLVNLKRLDFSHTTELQMFPAGILPKLSNLQDFRMEGSDWKWESKEIMVVQGTCVEELISLTRLEILCIRFSDLHSFNSYVKLAKQNQWPRFENYRLYIGFLEFHEQYEKEVYLNNCNLRRGDVSLVLPEDTQELMITECHGLTKLSELSSLNNAKGLKKCYIQCCSEIEYILSSNVEDDEKESCSLLQNLEILSLWGLDNLRALYKGVAPPIGILSALKFLQITDCQNLKNLLKPGLLQYLQNLEKICVLNCSEMEEIIAAEEETSEGNNSNTITLPRLQKLQLHGLLKLKSIYRGVMICTSLRTIDVLRCKELKRLPMQFCVGIEQILPPSTLKEIKGSRRWWDSLQWNHPNAITTLLQFLFIEVEEREEDDDEFDFIFEEGEQEQ